MHKNFVCTKNDDVTQSLNYWRNGAYTFVYNNSLYIKKKWLVFMILVIKRAKSLVRHDLVAKNISGRSDDTKFTTGI